MEANGKLVHSHHLACLSGLSQAPLLSGANPEGGNDPCERYTPVSLHPSAHGSPSKMFQHAVSTPVAAVESRASVFFPPFAAAPVSTPGGQSSSQTGAQKPPPLLPRVPNSMAKNNQQQPPFSPSVRPPKSPAVHRPDVNMNSELEFNREAGRRVSPPSASTAQTFSGFFPPAQNASCTNSKGNHWSQPDENYHLYHEPIDPDEQPDSPPPRPVSSSFADRASKKTSGHPNDVSADIYFCYVTLTNQRSNQRLRSSHGETKNLAQDQYPGARLGLPVTDAGPKIQSSPSTAELPGCTTPLGPAGILPVHFRDHCVRELLETESNYVHALEMMISCFAKPLEGLLRREDNQLIFGHIKYFHQVHSSFQSDLVKAAFGSCGSNVECYPISKGDEITKRSNPPTPTQFLAGSSPLSSPTNSHGASLSACFLHTKDKFLKYGEYCATLSRAQDLLDELTSRNEAFAMQLDHCQHEANEGKFKLRDLLSLPMQRILKYHLLLAQLIKNTSPANDDYHGLKRAHEAMVDLGQYINEVKRDTEAIQIINEIEQSITGLNMPANTQLTDYGRLVTDGVIRVKFSSDAKSKPLNEAKLKQKRYVFVFDKVVLMCKLSGVRGYQYKEAIVLSDYDLDVNPVQPMADAGSKHAAKDKWIYQFNLVRLSDRSTCCLFAKALDMKNKWVTALQRAIDNTRPAVCKSSEISHEFLMHSFDKASSCDHCGKLLLGLYYQGYRCRSCFVSVHKRCLALVRSCGPVLPQKNTASSARVPSSPSVRSNCSDDSRNMFLSFSNMNSSSTPCVDMASKNDYNNIRGRIGDNSAITSSFRENGHREPLLGQRPVSSMVNVSLQNNDSHHSDTVNSYVNFLLDGHPWFCGPMERGQAQSLLEKMPHGTFLVRVSPKHNGSYVISLNHNNQVKHMRIYVSKDNQLYLSQNRYFKSVIELVSWYERHSLVESFHMLDANLSIPYKRK